LLNLTITLAFLEQILTIFVPVKTEMNTLKSTSDLTTSIQCHTAFLWLTGHHGMDWNFYAHGY